MAYSKKANLEAIQAQQILAIIADLLHDCEARYALEDDDYYEMKPVIKYLANLKGKCMKAMDENFRTPTPALLPVNVKLYQDAIYKALGRLGHKDP